MVKKITPVYGVALVLLALAAVMVVSTKSSAKADSPAVVITDSFCIFLSGNGRLVFASESQAVVTASGNRKITCTGQVTPSSTAQGAVHWNFDNTGMLCSTSSSLSERTEQQSMPILGQRRVDTYRL